MSHLLTLPAPITMTGRRARSADAKAARREDILRAARGLLTETSFAELTVADVATRAGVAKGTVFLYFATKEALALSVVEQRFLECYDELVRTLDAIEKPVTPGSLAKAVAYVIDLNRPLIELLMVLAAILEHNVDRAQGRLFEERLMRATRKASAAIERATPWIGKGDGQRVIRVIRALATGLYPVTNPAAPIRDILTEPEFQGMHFSFAVELESALVRYFSGLKSEGSKQQ